MIIKLTEQIKDGGKQSVYVNIEKVQFFSKSLNNVDTRLKFEGTTYLFVKETPEQILDMMFPKMIAPVTPIDLRERFVK